MMKELCSKFLSLLCYVPYIIDEKLRIQHFLSCLPLMFKGRIKYQNLKSLEETMRNTNLRYDQNKENDKVYLNGKIKYLKVLKIKSKVQNFIKKLGISIEDIKEIVLKIINRKIISCNKRKRSTHYL